MIQKIIIGVCLLFSFLSTGIFIYTQSFSKKEPVSNEKEFEKMKDELKKPVEAIDGFKLKKIMINLEQETGKEKIRFLNIEAILVPFKEEGTGILEDGQAIVYDTFFTIASKMEANELNTISGKILLENRIRKKINERLGEEVVREILFQHFMVQ